VRKGISCEKKRKKSLILEGVNSPISRGGGGASETSKGEKKKKDVPGRGRRSICGRGLFFHLPKGKREREVVSY